MYALRNILWFYKFHKIKLIYKLYLIFFIWIIYVSWIHSSLHHFLFLFYSINAFFYDLRVKRDLTMKAQQMLKWPRAVRKLTSVDGNLYEWNVCLRSVCLLFYLCFDIKRCGNLTEYNNPYLCSLISHSRKML